MLVDFDHLHRSVAGAAPARPVTIAWSSRWWRQVFTLDTPVRPGLTMNELLAVHPTGAEQVREQAAFLVELLRTEATGLAAR